MMCANVARVAVVGCFGNDGVTKHQACSVGVICYEGAFLICGWLDPWVCSRSIWRADSVSELGQKISVVRDALGSPN